MALRFMDSFDHYANGDFLTKWTLATGTGDVTGTGRTGNCYTGSTSNTRNATKTIDAQATWIVGFAMKVTSQPASQISLVLFLDAGAIQTDLRLNASQQLEVTRNGTLLGTGTTVLSANVWYYIEMKVTISDASGVAIVKINGVTDINLSSVDTKATANATANQIRISPSSASFSVNYDDVYICDGTGGSPANDFLGDCTVEALFPNGNGNSSQFDGSDGNSTDNYLLVDEADPNSDTDYVESPDVGDKDTYAYGNLTAGSGTVYGVQVLPWARKTDAGVRSIVSVARLSATEVDSTDKALSTTYTYYPDIREAKPGGGAWTVSDVNSAEFGQKVSA